MIGFFRDRVRQIAARSIEAAHKTSVAHAQRVPQHSVTKKNAEFVHQYGFGDLSNDAIRQYRDRHAALANFCKRYPEKDWPSLKEKINTLYQSAGANPKLRGNVNQLYVLVREHGENLTSKEFAVALDLCKKGPIRLHDGESRRAFTALLRSGRIYRKLCRSKSGLSSLKTEEVNGILKHLGQVPCRGPFAWGTAGNLAIYALSTRRSYGLRARSEDMLAKLGVGSSKKYEALRLKEWNDALETIARSDDPQEEREFLVREQATTASLMKARIGDAVKWHYSTILRAHGFHQAFAESMAYRIYEAGGPRSRAGAMILTNLLAIRHQGKVSKERVVSLIKELHSKTLGIQPAILESTDFDAIVAPSGHGHASLGPVERAARGIFGNAWNLTDASSSPVATALEFGGAESMAAAVGAVSVLTSVVGSALTAVQIASIWKDVRAKEAAYYGARGFWTAIEAGADYGRLPHIDSEAILGRRAAGVRGTIHEAGAHAFKRTFAHTYERLKSMTEKGRRAYCAAMIEMRSEFHLKH